MNDITGQIGDLYPLLSPEVPMYSFSRPAYIFWQGFYDGLIKRGFTHEIAIREMQSKGVRWMLDSEDNKLKELGAKMAESYSIYHAG